MIWLNCCHWCLLFSVLTLFFVAVAEIKTHERAFYSLFTEKTQKAESFLRKYYEHNQIQSNYIFRCAPSAFPECTVLEWCCTALRQCVQYWVGMHVLTMLTVEQTDMDLFWSPGVAICWWNLYTRKSKHTHTVHAQRGVCAWGVLQAHTHTHTKIDSCWYLSPPLLSLLPAPPPIMGFDHWPVKV